MLFLTGAAASPLANIPDVTIKTHNGFNLILEIKGRMSDDADLKAKATTRWINAVHRLKTWGERRYLLVTDPGRVSEELNAFTDEKWIEGELRLS